MEGRLFKNDSKGKAWCVSTSGGYFHAYIWNEHERIGLVACDDLCKCIAVEKVPEKVSDFITRDLLISSSII